MAQKPKVSKIWQSANIRDFTPSLINPHITT